MSRDGHIELDWAVDAIRTGSRARQDLGDLAELVTSISKYGLLQPITVSPDGMLLCGARRLAAVRELGLRTVSVWVRSGISSRLQRLVAEQDENTLRQPLLPTEAAALYRELKQILLEDAARRQEASRFGADQTGSGAADLAAPPGAGDTRRHAARQVTGGNSYTRLEQIGEVQRAVEDLSLPEDVRRKAAEALAAMDRTGKVDGHHRQVRAAVDRARQQQLTDLARDAVDEATSPRAARPSPAEPRAVRRLGVGAFLLTWNELDGWERQYEAAAVGIDLTTAQFDRFARTVAATVEFLDAARRARESTATPVAS